MLRLASLVAVFALAGANAASDQPQDPGARQVILISIDGFAAFHLDNRAIDLPNIRALAAHLTELGAH